MTDTESLVRAAHHRGVATLTLDSPANRNALSAALVAELRATLKQCGKDGTVRAIVLTHTGTTDLPEHLRRADVIVAAAGVAHLVRPEDVKPGAIVLDVGVSRQEDPEGGKARLVGDVAPGVSEVAAWLSPNPGGVGPMTRALLMKNVVEAAERAAGIEVSA